MTLSPIRALLAVGMCGLALLGQANGFEIVSARQTSPGNILVTVNDSGPELPKASELALRIDDSPEIRASSVASESATAVPSWLLLCVDRSGSIGPSALADLKSAMTNALVRSGPADLPFKVSVVAFGSQSTHLLGFTNQRAQVATAIDRLGPDLERAGKTRLFDAIAGGLATLRAEGDGNKRLIVVSDGKDEGSNMSAARLGQLAQTAPTIPIDGVSFGVMAAANSGSLSSIAGETGGRFIQAGNPTELDQALQRMISIMAPRPAVTVAFAYTPSADKRTSESASLIYTAEGRPAARQPLGISVAAATVTPAAPPHETPATSSGLFSNWKFDISLSLFKDVPPVLIWLAAAVLILALVLLGLRFMNRDKDDDKPEDANQGDVNLTVVHTSKTVLVRPPTPPPPARSKNTIVGYSWPAPRPSQPTALLRGVSGSSRGEVFGMEKIAYRIGCAPDNDLVLIGDDFASGYHALMRYESGALYVEDLGSTNGSYLNGATFKSATRSLSPGDELRFGHTTFELSVADSHSQHAARSSMEPRVK